jgi:hypothetical protein
MPTLKEQLELQKTRTPRDPRISGPDVGRTAFTDITKSGPTGAGVVERLLTDPYEEERGRYGGYGLEEEEPQQAGAKRGGITLRELIEFYKAIPGAWADFFRELMGRVRKPEYSPRDVTLKGGKPIGERLWKEEE